MDFPRVTFRLARIPTDSYGITGQQPLFSLPPPDYPTTDGTPLLLFGSQEDRKPEQGGQGTLEESAGGDFAAYCGC